MPHTQSTADVVVPQSCQGEEIAVLEELPAVNVGAANSRESLRGKGLSDILVIVFVQVI